MDYFCFALRRASCFEWNLSSPRSLPLFCTHTTVQLPLCVRLVFPHNLQVFAFAMSSPPNMAEYHDQDQTPQMRGERARQRAAFYRVTSDQIDTPPARPTISVNNGSDRSSSRSNNGLEVPESAATRPGQLNSTAFPAPRSSSRLSSGISTPTEHSPVRERGGWGLSKLFSPFKSHAYTTANKSGNVEMMEKPAPSRSNDSRADYNSVEYARYSENSGEYSATTSQAGSRRGSFQAGLRFSDSPNGPRPANYSRRDVSSFNAESIPGTPLAPPTPQWVYQSRSSSPVASSLYLPGQGNTHSPGHASMSSLASSPYVGIVASTIFVQSNIFHSEVNAIWCTYSRTTLPSSGTANG